MRRLLRLPQAAPRAASLRREWVDVALADGGRIPLLRVRDPRARRIKLSVDERGVRLTLPPHASLAAADRFLHAQRDWLTRQLQRQAQAGGDALRVGGTTELPLRGEHLPLRWDPGSTTRLTRDQEGGLRFSVAARAGEAALRRALREFYEAEGRADVGRWLPRYLSGLPQAPRRIVFKRTTSQWGSLAPDGTLSLDLALMLVPPQAFEYVLVHELCHLLHRDHSAVFWREVAARLPLWQEQRDFLRHHGGDAKARLRQLLAG